VDKHRTQSSLSLSLSLSLPFILSARHRNPNSGELRLDRYKRSRATTCISEAALGLHLLPCQANRAEEASIDAREPFPLATGRRSSSNCRRFRPSPTFPSILSGS
jgi:hypothetical protein